jgi:hypothetical protein
MKTHMEHFYRTAETAHRIQAARRADATLTLLQGSVSITPPVFPLQNSIPRRNTDFIGRSSSIGSMESYLETQRSANGPLLCIVYGLAGVGKTEIALEYAHLVRNKYQALFWVNAENKPLLRSSLGSIGRKLGLFADEDVTDAKVERIVDFLENTGTLCTF